MHSRPHWLLIALGCLALACSEGATLPAWEAEAPPFAYSLYLSKGEGDLIPGTDVLLVRRPEHLDHVYALSVDDVDTGRKADPRAKKLFGLLERQFTGAGIAVAERVVSLRCAVVELPDCMPQWRFLEELLGPNTGPGAQRLRQALADSFEATARQRGLENTVRMAAINVFLSGGMMKTALGKAATAEARAATVAEHRAAAAPVARSTPRAAGGGHAAAVGAERVALEARRLGVTSELSAIEARLVEAEALEAGARQTAVVKDLSRLRPSLARPPAGTAADDALWRDYVAYWEKRYLELTDPAGKAAGVLPPRTWPGYQLFRTRFIRALEYQGKVSTWLRGELSRRPAERRLLREMEQPRLDDNVGLKPKGRGSLTYADHFVVDEATLGRSTPRVETVSTKQRDFKTVDRTEIQRQVMSDTREALSKYGGEVEVRRPGHPLFGRSIRVSHVYLVYDESLAPLLPAWRKEMIQLARREGVELHFYRAP